MTMQSNGEIAAASRYEVQLLKARALSERLMWLIPLSQVNQNLGPAGQIRN